MNVDNGQEREPTSDELRKAEAIEQAIMQELKLQGPVPVAVILTSLFTVIAKIISYQSGANQVAPWFARQAILAQELLKDDPSIN